MSVAGVVAAVSVLAGLRALKSFVNASSSGVFAGVATGATTTVVAGVVVVGGGVVVLVVVVSTGAAAVVAVVGVAPAAGVPTVCDNASRRCDRLP